MLLGQSVRSIDNKGRIILPKEFREDFVSGLVVTKGLDACLLLFPMAEWEKKVAKIAEMPEGKEDTRRFTRLFFPNATRLMPDAQGRILIPQHLKEMAGLKREAVVIGLSNKAEIWDPDKWQRYNKESEERYEEAASRLGV